MWENITVVGNVATDPKQGSTPGGVGYVTLRVASDARRKDAGSGEWVDGDPNWYTVNAYRALAENIHASVRVGDRVVVHGRLRVRAWTDGEKKGTAVEIIADAFGADLRWGTTTFRRATKSVRVDPDADADGFVLPEDPEPHVAPAAEPRGESLSVPF